MTQLAKPGIYHQPVRPSRRFGGLARGDVPVLLGYATRGPAMAPVRIESLRQFEGIFGPRLGNTHLFDAVKGFFECGGRTAYVVRVVGAGAQVATAALIPQIAGPDDFDPVALDTIALSEVALDGPDLAPPANIWRVSAHFPTAALRAAGQPDAGSVWRDTLHRSHGQSIPDPGAWANTLSVKVTRQTRVRTTAITIASDPLTVEPLTLNGIDVGALVAFHDGPASATPEDWFVARVARIDAPSGLVTLDRPLTPDFDLTGDPVLELQVVSFDVEILNSGVRAELFEDLHLDDAHPRSIQSTLGRSSMFVGFAGPDATDWTDVTLWPQEGMFTLSGGTDDLQNITANDWRTALASQADIDEIALVAAPDLVLQEATRRTEFATPIPAGNTCHLPFASPKGRMIGKVIDGATNAPVAGCTIIAAGNAVQAVTDVQGAFSLTGLTQGLVELRLSADGFEPAEHFAQTSTPQSAAELIEIPLVKLSDIRALDETDVRQLQREMGTGGIAGSYRIAVLDPPAPDLSPEDLLQWRGRLGSDRRLFAVAPWFEVARTGQETLMRHPPSGHICGAFARAELNEGIHRAPANLTLRHVKQLSVDLDDAALASFHAASLNAIRALPGQGMRLMGSRTLATDYAWQQVSVRRVFDAIEKTLQAQLSWSVFEPNNITTRQIMKFAVSQFLESLRKRGMFAGTTANEAYSVKCDGDNNRPASIARGEVILEIGIAPTRPYEFILFTLSAEADAIEVTEQL